MLALKKASIFLILYLKKAFSFVIMALVRG